MQLEPAEVRDTNPQCQPRRPSDQANWRNGEAVLRPCCPPPGLLPPWGLARAVTVDLRVAAAGQPSSRLPHTHRPCLLPSAGTVSVSPGQQLVLRTSGGRARTAAEWIRRAQDGALPGTLAVAGVPGE